MMHYERVISDLRQAEKTIKMALQTYHADGYHKGDEPAVSES